MEENIVYPDNSHLVSVFIENLMEKYSRPLYEYVEENPELINTVPGFLLSPDHITVFIGRTHIAAEYSGPEFITHLNQHKEVNVRIFNYTMEECNLLEKIIGFEFDSTREGMTIPLPPISIELLFPTNKGFEKLCDLGWNFHAQNSIMGFNIPSPSAMPNQFTRIINGMFFDANDHGLVTRRIKWLDMIPIYFDGTDEEQDTIGLNFDFYEKLIEHDARFQYPVPDDFKFSQLPKINRFIEMWGNKETTEPQITTFLNTDANKFILTMKFGAIDAHGELTCIWQSEDRDDIRPDFFIVQPNGYADIVEFKLPDIEKNTIVGKKNRETFAAWLHSYISQTRVYSTYFDDPNNRKWFEDKYCFKVHKPKRYLVVGRRYDFTSEIWREIIADYKDIEIITFDDLVDGVTIQFYK